MALPVQPLPRSSRAGMEWLALLSALLMLGLLFMLDFQASFRHHREQALADLDKQAERIETRVEHQLETLHFALGNLQAVVADARSPLGRSDLKQRLNGILDSLTGVRTLAIFDAEGNMTLSNRSELVGGNFAHRDYFSMPRASPDPARLHVSPPYRTVLGVLSITVSRAVVSRDGQFVGVVSATLDPDFFADLLQTGATTEDMYILLSMGDPRLAFAATPAAAPAWLRDLADQGGIPGILTGAREVAGEALPIVEVRGSKRAVAVHWAQTGKMAKDAKIRVLVSRQLTALDRGGYHDLAFKVGLYVFIVVVSVLLLWWFQRQRWRLRQEREKQAQIVRDSERFVRTLAENFPGLLAYWTPDLRCAFANHAHQEWFGFPADEMIGMRIEAVLGEKSFRIVEPHVRAALRGETQRFERALVKVDGTSHHTWVQYLPDSDGSAVRGFMVLVTDISEVKQGQFALQDAHQKLQTEIGERKRAERELVQLNADLAARTGQAEAANVAKSRFLSSVSHELRTPLHSILGYSRLLLKASAGEAKRQLEVVERSGAQLLKLIDDLLEFNLETGEAGELQTEVVVLRDFINQLERTGQLLAMPGSNRFSVALADNLPAAVWVDEQRLLQVLQNLLGNACKYTRNGSVTLRVAREDDKPGTAGVASCRLCFAVEDTGAGIAGDDLERIFEAFNRGAAQHGQPGLGLGLSIARKWVRAMGGDIQVSSELGLGSRFFFTLELLTASGSTSVPASACEAFREALAAMPRTVLVADDVAENRLLLHDLCQRWGFGVAEAADGDAALRRCLAAAPPIDAALVDQFMPVADGWEFLRRVRQTSALAQLPMVLISASAAQKPENFPPAVDFDLTLLKPIDEQALACFLCRRLRLVEPAPAGCSVPMSVAEVAMEVVLPPHELARFREMLDLGRVFGIEEWAKQLAAGDAVYTAFAERAVQHCRAGNLVALEAMAVSRTRLPGAES